MKTKFALCAMLLCLASAIVVGQQVSVNYNQSFAGYHTYAWVASNANQIQNSILAQVAQQDIDSAMVAKGFAKSPKHRSPTSSSS